MDGRDPDLQSRGRSGRGKAKIQFVTRTPELRKAVARGFRHVGDEREVEIVYGTPLTTFLADEVVLWKERLGMPEAHTASRKGRGSRQVA